MGFQEEVCGWVGVSIVVIRRLFCKKYIIEIANPEPDGELKKLKLQLMQKPRTTTVIPLFENAKCQVTITGTYKVYIIDGKEVNNRYRHP